MLSDELKKVFLAGVGAVAMTAEKSKDLVDQLVAKGEITMEQGKVLNEELKRKCKERLREAVEDAPTEDGVESLLAKIDALSDEERARVLSHLAGTPEDGAPEA